MATKKKAAPKADKPSAKDIAEQAVIIKQILSGKKPGMVLVALPGDKSLEVHGLGYKFGHKDMHHLVEALIQKIHPEVALIGQLMGGLLGGAVHSAPQGKKK